MILVLDVGNSQIFCGVFEDEKLVIQFRYASTARGSSDEIGVFLRGALRENGIAPEDIATIAISSVVPELNYTLWSCCQKYFDLEPMVLRPGLKTGLKIDYKDPKEVGSDRIADAMGAVKMFPDRNLIVIDFGTATTVCAVSKDRVFLCAWLWKHWRRKLQNYLLLKLSRQSGLLVKLRLKVFKMVCTGAMWVWCES